VAEPRRRPARLQAADDRAARSTPCPWNFRLAVGGGLLRRGPRKFRFTHLSGR
jgi:hypothetical protein